MIYIVNLEISNIASVANMLKKAGSSSIVTNDPDELSRAEKIILPGVGSFDHAMKAIDRFGLKDVLLHHMQVSKMPVLGICLGMHLLFEHSEEGSLPGLGVVRGSVVRFDSTQFPSTQFRIPHMGWNTVQFQKPTKLWDNEARKGPDRFYFVHSYHVVCQNAADVATTTQHGYSFTSSIEHENILGVQFHPEKSHRHGLRLLRAFHELT